MNYYKNGNSYIATIGDLSLPTITKEEFDAQMALSKQRIQKQAKVYEKMRPRTIDEGIMELNRTILVDKLADTEDKTLAIACMAFFKPWTNGIYEVGDIRTNPATGYPRECILAHDSTLNANWDVMTPSLWKPYHSRKAEYALPYEAPTGAHDIYKAGEYMIWTDGEIYKCLSDTNYSPDEYAGAWEIVE